MTDVATKRLREAAERLGSHWLASCLMHLRMDLAREEGRFLVGAARSAAIIRAELGRRGIPTKVGS